MAMLLLPSDRTLAIGRHSATIVRPGPAEIVPALAILALLAIATDAQADGDPAAHRLLVEERRQIRATETADLSAIAFELDRAGQSERAAAVRALIEPSPPADGPQRFEPLPEIVPAPEDAPEAETDSASTEDPIADRVAEIRNRAANSYRDLADRAFEAQRLALADTCLREVLRRCPDDPEARRLLGYVPHQGGWATPHAVMRLENGDIPHPTFGWIPADYEPKLAQGLLPAPRPGGRGEPQWIPAEEADALRQDSITSGWRISTPHFKILASVTLDEGVDFARRLEDFHDLFTSVAADVIGPQRLPLARLHRVPGSTAPPTAPRQHLVYYFGTKDQYVDYLLPLLGTPKIRDTLGIYLDDRKTSYFFKDNGGQLAVEATLYHEVSHQLLFELSGPAGYLRNLGHFWVFEGFGCYFETVQPQPDGSILFGGPVGPRIAEARRRIVEQDELIPIARFVTFDRRRFNADDGEGDPYLHYAQAIALTVFLMDHDRGAFRDGFLDYLADAYRGRLRAGSSRALASQTGLSYDQLDQALRAFLAEAVAPTNITELRQLEPGTRLDIQPFQAVPRPVAPEPPKR